MSTAYVWEEKIPPPISSGIPTISRFAYPHSIVLNLRVASCLKERRGVVEKSPLAATEK
jgi:hypothetical protein